jgi:hypothetical protein
MTEKDDHPAASHFAFPYYFSDVEGIQLTGFSVEIVLERARWEDLKIFYDTLEEPNIIRGWCTRWDTSDYSVTIETWLNKTNVQNLVTNLRPGAVTELYQILGKPYYYDQSWTGDNTLRIIPEISSSSNLKNMRKEVVIYPKNISTSPVIGRSDWFMMKIEGYLSGSSL